MFDLGCYGDAVTGLEGIVPALDLRSATLTRSWYSQTWARLASSLGFSKEWAAARATLRGADDPIVALRRAGILAFDRAIAASVSGARREGSIGEAQARSIESALSQMIAAGHARGELWRVQADPTALRGGACYEADDGRAHRSFYVDSSAGLFAEGLRGAPPAGESACGWQTPATLYLGTFPYVYSTRLGGGAPGMRWAAGDVRPATLAFAAMASLIEPEVNLRQDARQVAAIAGHFLAHVGPLVRRLPVFAARRGPAAGLTLRGGLLHAHGQSLHRAELHGPRGVVTASAYNFVVERIACFFAVRKAALWALPALPIELRRLAEGASDPCLRAHAIEARRVG